MKLKELNAILIEPTKVRIHSYKFIGPNDKNNALVWFEGNFNDCPWFSTSNAHIESIDPSYDEECDECDKTFLDIEVRDHRRKDEEE